MQTTTTTLKIQGMTCGGCVNSVKTVLKNQTGVEKVEVSLDAAQAIIVHDPASASIDHLKKIIDDAGFEVTN
ncbi:heavy-metal-associated domain-containing protein [Nitrosomonas aestuarii]|mgnify:CR=1 FL=1|uniref:Copper chaperone n=1 Tax=Nitrosomonas aestuarii TaxID=52441 RepID=A0A1I3YT68_9PROT|nr:heavy-metal-associated domain-containing protein [Nitrosomonas aestuarii]PTN12596.1 copper chaperone [Nitrosomonas aestuarii]SFK34431.1 copper chaperone [Nitrosomonas aestuarii]